VYVFLESVLSASCNTGGNKARKRFSATSWRCFNAMKTAHFRARKNKRVSFSTSISSSEPLVSPERSFSNGIKRFTNLKTFFLFSRFFCWIICHSALLCFASTYGIKICKKCIQIWDMYLNNLISVRHTIFKENPVKYLYCENFMKFYIY